MENERKTILPVVDGLSLLPFKAFWCWPLTKNHWQQLLIFHLSLQPKLCYNATGAVCATSKLLWKCLLLCLYVHMYPKASVTVVTSAKGGKFSSGVLATEHTFIEKTDHC